MSAGAMQGNLYSVKQVAAMLSICTRGVWRLVARGELPQPVKVGRASRFPASEICEYVDKIKKGRAS